MRISNCLTGECCMRRMRNLCEMYAKPMRRNRKEFFNCFFSMFGAFSTIISFAYYLYAKYAKVISCIYARHLTYHVSFRIFAYITDIVSTALFYDSEGYSGCLYAKICDFAYFRILRINQVK